MQFLCWIHLRCRDHFLSRLDWLKSLPELSIPQCFKLELERIILHCGGVAERPCVRLQSGFYPSSERIYKGSNPFPTFSAFRVYYQKNVTCAILPAVAVRRGQFFVCSLEILCSAYYRVEWAFVLVWQRNIRFPVPIVGRSSERRSIAQVVVLPIRFPILTSPSRCQE